MIVPVALAAAFAIGVDWRRLAVLGGAVYLPWAAAILVAWITWKARPGDADRSPLFCEGVAAELRAGSSLRGALTAAATSVGIAPRALGSSDDRPLADVAETLAEEFPAISDELRLTVLNASNSGSRAADLFDEIGSLAIAQSEMRRELRVATAPARAAAMLMIGAPTVYLVGRAGAGDLAVMLESSQQRIAVAIGLGLFMIGAVSASVVVWRASP